MKKWKREYFGSLFFLLLTAFLTALATFVASEVDLKVLTLLVAPSMLYHIARLSFIVSKGDINSYYTPEKQTINQLTVIQGGKTK
ncbi:MAG: hypothetical protein LBV67_09515 [Streptococcaceae bacterium]|jgi:hypothetical protein|nr:hypothetical protein [Streptococcaceae bacterium]